ncbi:substrate-binding domain-containing protein [Streptomyces europaeiscabiei]|nr:substrate-binding domain-containing protein [Streptomyces europaeiscabiei]MDX2758919.1 substrate-binding domain-containing protein [Streptomyces europaeiscabiei]
MSRTRSRRGHTRGTTGSPAPWRWRRCPCRRSVLAGVIVEAGDLPTAVVAFDDRCAIGVLAALARAGVDVRGRVSMVGHGDETHSRLSCFNPTAIGRCAEEQVRHVVTAAVERLDQDPTEPREVLLTPRLVPRGTTSGSVRPGPARRTARR